MKALVTVPEQNPQSSQGGSREPALSNKEMRRKTIRNARGVNQQQTACLAHASPQIHNTQYPLLSFCHVGSRDQTQVARLWVKLLYPLSCLPLLCQNSKFPKPVAAQSSPQVQMRKRQKPKPGYFTPTKERFTAHPWRT